MHFKLDGVFSIGMGLSLLKPPSRSAGPAQPATCTKKGGPAGVCRLPLRYLSQFLSYNRERDQTDCAF